MFLSALFLSRSPFWFIFLCVTKHFNPTTEFQLRVVHLHVNKLPLFVSCIQIRSLRLPAELRLSGFQWFGWHFIEWIWFDLWREKKRKRKNAEKRTPTLICSRFIDVSASHGSEHNGVADKQPILIQHATSAAELGIRVLEKATGGQVCVCRHFVYHRGRR